MPKTRSGDPVAVPPSFFLFIYKNERVIGIRPSTYANAVTWTRAAFPQISAGESISFQTKELDICDGEFATILSQHWEDIIPMIKSLKIVTNKLQMTVEPRNDGPSILLYFSWMNSTYQIRAPVYKDLQSVFETAHIRKEVDDKTRFLSNGRALFGSKSLEDNNLKEGDLIHAVMSLRGGKPVIYLFSPEIIDASVKLSLIPQWNLSAIYPIVSMKPRSVQTNEEVLWTVRVHPNGELTETQTGLDVAYLFWEAHTDSTCPSLLPASPIDSVEVEVFNPNRAILNNENSVVISVNSITPYLDKALKILGLHTEARTSFITYWLPSLLKHKHVAFRFLPQAAYEKAAPLEIKPAPSVITRVFMIFQGVKETELVDWVPALRRAQEDVSFWINIVGVNMDLALDETVFRVLEWGGMEIHRSST